MQLMAKYVNMAEEDLLLFVVYLVQGFSRSSSHFAAIVSSNKGTGKSTLTKLIRAIVDPSITIKQNRIDIVRGSVMVNCTSILFRHREFTHSQFLRELIQQTFHYYPPLTSTLRLQV